ncbi:hypothetical protein NL676_015659 [Syzygium grande]|nr:hypothetical protein NL676_015659 [Syzygium grande]
MQERLRAFSKRRPGNCAAPSRTDAGSWVSEFRVLVSILARFLKLISRSSCARLFAFLVIISIEDVSEIRLSVDMSVRLHPPLGISILEVMLNTINIGS